VDLLPTVLDYLGVVATNSFDGESLFRKTTDQVVIAAENGDLDPVRFCIQSPKYKAFFQYESLTRPTTLQRALYLKQVTDANDTPVTINLGSREGRMLLDTNFGAAFGSLFSGAAF